MVRDTGRKVIWSVTARSQMKDIFDYIKKDSLQNAQMVRRTIAATTKKLPDQPTRYPIDKYKNDNDGSFRAFQLFSYMISYQITDTVIIIVRVRYGGSETLSH